MVDCLIYQDIYRIQVDIQNKDLGEFGMYIRINIGYGWGTKVDK